MAAHPRSKKMNHSDSDDNDELFLPPSSTLSFHHAHLQRSEVNNSNAFFRSFSSDMEDNECFHQAPEDTSHKSGASNVKKPLKRQEPVKSQSSENEIMSQPSRVNRQGSIVDGLLHEIYDHWHCSRRDSFDSDTLTECSSTSEFMWCSRHDISTYSMDGGYQSSIERRQTGCYTRTFLQTQDLSQLSRILSSVQRLTTVMSARLVRQLKRRDRRLAKRNRNYDVVTAILQAASLKRQIDTRMRFSIQPPQGQPSAFDQWKDAMRAVCRLPMGIPAEFRKKVWLSLADHYLVQLRINWDKTVRFVFNERSNPDDDKLGMQIVKDLHRTGCSNFSGDDNVEDRAILKRVLLAYARWNKRVGYCQGFNVIAALLLNVMDRKEDDALKVMIFLIDSVLPESYFANNLRALSVDMAVFRDLLAITYPRLSKHLDRLQLQAQDVRTGACYEPPLTNVFTMQWFLTLFATCLPVSAVLRVWDSVLLEGSEILLRTALCIWGKLSKRILGVSSADEFYSVMGELSTSIMEGSVMDGDSIIKSIYNLGDFPFPHLNELREKYTYNIRPLTPSTSSGVRKVGGRSLIKAMLYSDDDDMDDDDVTAMACMPGEMSASSSDISVLGPGVYGPGLDPSGSRRGSGGGDMQMERMSTDINSLKLQYQRLKERQQQAHIIIAAASQKKAQLISSSSSTKKPLSSSSSNSSRSRGVPSLPSSILLPSIESPTAMNHLFVGKNKPPSASAKNRLITQGPRISQHASHHNTSSILSKQLQAVANAQAVSKSQRMRSSRSNNKQGDQTPKSTNAGMASSEKNANNFSSPSNTSNEGGPSDKDSSENKIANNDLCDSHDKKTSVDVTPNLIEDTDNSSEVDKFTPAPTVTIENVSESWSSEVTHTENAYSADSLDPGNISDKSVQTSFEVADHFDEVDHDIRQEDSWSISRDCPSLPTDQCDISEGITSPSSDNNRDLPLQTTHIHKVPYTDDDNSPLSPECVVSTPSSIPTSNNTNNDIFSPQSTYKTPGFTESTTEHNIPFQTANPTFINAQDGPHTVTSNQPSILNPQDHLPEDSGIDSSSTASPSTTPKRRPKPNDRSASLDDGIDANQSINLQSDNFKKDIVLSVSTTPLSNQCEISQSDKDWGNVDVSTSKTSMDIAQDNTAITVMNDSERTEYRKSCEKIEIDTSQDNSTETAVITDSSLTVQSLSIDSDISNPKDQCQHSDPSSPMTPEPILLSNIVIATSPQRKFFQRSVSCSVSSPGLIDTVPIPENLTGSGMIPRQKHHSHHTKQPATQASISSNKHTEKLSDGIQRKDSEGNNFISKTIDPTNSKSTSIKSGDSSAYNRRLSTPASFHSTNESSKKPFNPFPVKLFNANRAKTGLKLGLYSATTLEQLKGLKPRTTST